MKSANIPKNDEEYQKSVFSPTDESSTRLYAEMDALETEAVINENLVSGAVKNAVKHWSFPYCNVITNLYKNIEGLA